MVLNLILFEREEVGRPLDRSDPRAVHVLEVLRRHEGEEFDAGIVDGPLGKATLAAVDGQAIALTFRWSEEPPPLDPITLIAGMPRPQTARKVLEEATTLGVAALHFVWAEKGERNYAGSKLWSSGEWRRHLLAGASQAFSTRIPKVTWNETLDSTIARLAEGGTRLALDNYEYEVALSEAQIEAPVALCVGPERGWSGREREMLRTNGFRLVHAGARVLRVETACVAALTVVRVGMGLT